MQILFRWTIKSRKASPQWRHRVVAPRGSAPPLAYHPHCGGARPDLPSSRDKWRQKTASVRPIGREREWEREKKKKEEIEARSAVVELCVTDSRDNWNESEKTSLMASGRAPARRRLFYPRSGSLFSPSSSRSGLLRVGPPRDLETRADLYAAITAQITLKIPSIVDRVKLRDSSAPWPRRISTVFPAGDQICRWLSATPLLPSDRISSARKQ